MFALTSVKMMAQRNGTTFDARKALPFRNAVKFVSENERFNYTQFLDKVRMLANGFYELGMKPGESVMTWTDNRSETLASFYACALTGLRLVTVDPSIKEADVLRDIVKEAEPSALLFSPNSKKDCREHVLCEMIPELVSADKSIVMDPIKSREFRKLHSVATTAWDVSNVPGVMNFRTLLVDQVSPDLVSIVSQRLVNEPSTVLLRSYAYSLGKVLKSKDLTQGQIADHSERVASKLSLTADSIMGLDLPMFMPLALISAVACMQKSAMLVVPNAERDFAETKRVLGAEKVTALVTSERRAMELKSDAPASLKNALYPTECGVCKPMTGLKTMNF